MVLGNGCFSWSSKKQTAIALSTGKAEYYSVTHASCEVIWLQQLLTEIRIAPHIGTTLHIDNTSSICMIETPDQVTNHTKHINIAYHWIHVEVQKQTIVLVIHTLLLYAHIWSFSMIYDICATFGHNV